jgi:hypothetical protein
MVPLDNSDSSIVFHLVRAGTTGDTIAPFGSLKLRFTHPVMDPDSVLLSFQPQFTDYQLFLDSTKDTVALAFTQPLQARTRYSIHLAKAVSAEDGTLLFPSDDSIVVFTAAAEQEPNNTPALADTLRGKLFGQISMVDDSDWFAVPDTTLRTFYLKSTGSSSRFDICDAKGAPVAQLSAFAAAETLTVPSDCLHPLYIVVSAWNRENGGYYELGVARR